MADTRSILFFKPATEEAPAAPDSTTSMFVEGEDVLVDRNHTGQFFMGTIVQIDRPTEKCLLRFLDNKECWAHLSELQRVKDDPEEILCVICKKIEQNVVRCPKCGRGYHRSCLELSIPDGIPASKWLCIRCGNKNLKKKRARLSLALAQASAEHSSSAITCLSEYQSLSVKPTSIDNESMSVSLLPFRTPSTSKEIVSDPVKRTPIRSFPYAIHSLVWDDAHKVNDSGQYCYCGKSGKWYMQMLQCAICRQWFHQDCLSCLHFPLYCGDQLYIFLCSVCNDVEFLRRFEFGWVDIIHLSIFNLVLFRKKKYFDLDTEIIPYVKNNWFYLQIPAQLVKCSDPELRRIILKMLEDNSTKSCRFKLGREIKTKKRIWGLRVRVPPNRKAFSLPPVRPLTDDAVRTWWKKCHTTFLQALDTKYLMNGDIVLQPDGGMSPFDYGLMFGQVPGVCKITFRSLNDAAIGINLLDSSVLLDKFASQVNGSQGAVQGSDGFSGCAKKTSAFSACNRLTLQESLRRNRRAQQNRVSPRTKALTKKDCGGEQIDVLENSSQDGYESADSQTSYSQDDNISSNAVSLEEESLDENDVSQDGYDSSEELSDGATEESVSSLALDECQSAGSREEDRLIVEDGLQICDVKPKLDAVIEPLKIEVVVEKLLPETADQASNEQSIGYQLSVDTPSVASPATDSIMPSVSSTPADTEAEDDTGGVVDMPMEPLPSILDLIGAPIVIQKPPATPVIPPLPRLTPVIKEPPQARAVKRKLSEKDIKIVNGQVKQRRRMRRCQSNQTFGTKTVHLDSGEKLEKRIVGGKLLRSPHKPPAPETTPDFNLQQMETPTSSSASSAFVRPEGMSLDDVKKDIKSIFNARNRIAAGENFLIKGKRVTADGVEYLIQWDYSL